MVLRPFLSQRNVALTSSIRRFLSQVQHSSSESIMSKSSSIKVLQIPQGGSFHIDSRLVSNCKIKITSSWIDHGEVIGCSRNVTIAENRDTNSCTLTVQSDNNSHNDDGNHIELKVPEICNIHIQGDHIDASLHNKIMGDLTIQCNAGSIEVDKIRGEKLTFSLGKGDLTVKKLLEGSRGDIQCRGLTAKMIHFERIAIYASESVRMEACYSGQSSIKSNGNITVDLLRGHLSAISLRDMFIRGVDGHFDLESANGRIELQINKLTSKSKSLARSSNGNVLVKVDPKIASRVKCQSAQDTTSATRNSITVTSNTFIQTVNTNTPLALVEGVLMGSGNVSTVTTSDETNLGKSSTRKQTSGKINLHTAESQSLDVNSFHSTHNKTLTSHDNVSTNQDDSNLPEMTFVSNAHIRVESLSWMDAIKLNHGLPIGKEAQSSNIRSRLGRTGRANLDAMELSKKSMT